MGFYLRKSFRAGPIRFNLSKSGVGISGGVRGARVGVSSTGRAYVHAGRRGLYVRQSLGSGRSSGRSTTAATPLGASGPVTLEENTGATYGAPDTGPPTAGIGDELVRRKARRYFYVPLGALGLAIVLPAEAGAFVVLAAVAIVWPGLLAHSWQQRRQGDKLGALLEARFAERKPMPIAAQHELVLAVSHSRLHPADRQYFQRLSYLNLAVSLIEDAKVDAAEVALLQQAEEICGQDRGFYELAKLEAFRRVYMEAVADHDLTEDEERALVQIREALGLSEEDLSEELAWLDRLREVRGIREGQLPDVESPKALRKQEACHFASAGRILKSRVLRSFQRDGQKYKVRGFAVDKEGTLVITNKRVLLIHTGTTSIALDKILDVEVDADQQVLTITKDGAARPVHLTTPDALKAGAVLSVLTA